MMRLSLIILLLSAWSANGSQITIVPDASGNSATGYAAGAPVLVASPRGAAFGNALSFSGVFNNANTDAIIGGPGNLFFAFNQGGSFELSFARTRSGVVEKLGGQWTGSALDFLLYFTADNVLNFSFYDSGNVQHFLSSGSTKITDTAAHTTEVSWDGANIRLFIDGTVTGTLAFSGNMANTMGTFSIGRGEETSNDAFAGTIDEVRFSTVARHTANYTPASSPFVPDASTSLLWHFDTAPAVTSSTFARVQSTPVLVKGGVYDGWTADAFAAPAACYDGTRYVMAVSMWSITNAQWATGYFTSPDLLTWTYVSGSLRAPQGSDYILGNGGIVWWHGKYWQCYAHYPFNAPITNGITIQWSTDLLTWTTTVSNGFGSRPFDSSLVINPTSGNLEMWCISNSLVVYSDSADGTTWTDHGAQCMAYFNTLNFGEPQAFYYNGLRWLTVDGTTVSGHRAIQMMRGSTLYANYSPLGEVLSPGANAWESTQVFDGSVVLAANGTPYLLYAGGDNNSTADNTDSSIGLAKLNVGQTFTTTSKTFGPVSVSGTTFTTSAPPSNGNNHMGIGIGIGISALFPQNVPYADSDAIGRIGFRVPYRHNAR